MRNLILKNPLITALGLACTVLLAILVVELLVSPAPSAIPAPPSTLPHPPSSVKKDDFSLPPLSHYQEIVERPLFLQSRRPVPQASGETSPLGPKEAHLNQYALTAVIIGPDKRLALIRSTADKGKKALRLEEGQDLQGWRLKEIKDESAIFQQVNQQQELRLQRKTPPQFAFDKRRPPVPFPPPATPGSTEKAQGKAPPAQEQSQGRQPLPKSQGQSAR